MSYGFDQVEQWRGAAGYCDRILHGAAPGDLPVQAPTKYDLVINLRTAKALGLTISPSLLATAVDVIDRIVFSRCSTSAIGHLAGIRSDAS